jgi:hypothetical protein
MRYDEVRASAWVFALSFAVACAGGAPSGAPASGTGGIAPVGTGGIAGVGVGGADFGGASGASPGGALGSGTGGAAGGPSGTAGSGSGGSPPRAPDLSHTLDAITIAAGDEVIGTCQSFTLNNDAPLYVNTIVESNRGGFHHSNWIWVADTLYPGPDGTWKCTDRGFDQIAAGASGGVFFAQSTQSRSDKQGFAKGVAFVVPAHARIVGDVHLMNLTQDPITTSLTFDVYTEAAADVRVQLHPMAFTNLNLDIAPLGKTSAHMQCAMPQPNFDVYYILPHFHALGQGMRIDVAGGAMAGTNLFQSAGNLGESMGQSFDPPLSVTGATGLGVTCDYDNPRTAAVHYGMGDQEMCVALIYSSGIKAGGETISNLTVTDTGGVHKTDGLCVSVGSP